MSAHFREDPFESLKDKESVELEKSFRIPSNLLSPKEVQRGGKSSILTFEYDTSRKHFQYTTSRAVNSLFFYLQEYYNKLEVLNKFIIIRFSEKRDHETILYRDRTIETLLRQGVDYKNDTYNIVGCSNSQLQRNSFVFMKGTRAKCDAEVKHYIPNIDKLQQSIGVAKRVKYVGLLFTDCQYILTLPLCDVEYCDDIIIGSFNFTDGCGLISMKLAQDILKQNKELQNKWKNGIPSIWQIRFYDGIHLCKGVLVLHRKNTTTSVLTLRQSLIKINNSGGRSGENRLGIVDTSYKHKIGKLNKQVVTLLSESVDKSVLLGIQERYLKTISETRYNALEAVKSAALTDQFPLYTKLLRKRALEGFLPKEYTKLVQIVEETFMSTWQKEGGIVNETKDRIEIPIASSRLLFGAAYPEELDLELKEGECIVCIETGIHEGLVIVNRSPSYSPGDIRVLKAIKPKQADSPVFQMRNVVFFATRGKRPDPDKMSGGDLDGDMYLVIWDKKLLEFATKITVEEPMSYAHTSKHKQSNEDWISHVAKWENSILAKIDSYFYYLAERRHGVKSKECKDLCDLFSRSVDCISSDLNRLNNIFSKFSVPKKKKSKGSTHSPDKTVWLIMIDRTADTLKYLKEKREKFPSKKDWKDFYSSLVHLDTGDVLKALESSDVSDCVIDKNRIDQVKEFWCRICEGKPIPVLEEIISPTCSYDCELRDCLKSHSTEPLFYSAKWREKIHAEIMHVIKYSKEEKEDNCSNIKEHEKLRKVMLNMNSDAKEKYEKERKSIERKMLPLKHIWKIFFEIMHYDDLLKKARANIEDSTFWDKFKSKWKGIVRERSVAFCYKNKHDVFCYENKMLELHHQLKDRANDLSFELGLSWDLCETFEELPESKILTKIQNKILSMVNIARGHVPADPEILISPSCVENVEKLIAITKGRQDDLIEQKKENMEELKKKENLLRDKEKLIEKIDEDIIRNSNYTDSLLNEKHHFMEELNKLNMNSTGSEGNTEAVLSALTNKKFLVEVESEIYIIAQNIQKLKEKIKKVSGEANEVKHILKLLEKEGRNFEEKLESGVKDISSLDDEIRHVYNKKKHDEAIEKYQYLNTGSVEGFDLALNALDHEVEAHFAVKKVTDEDRIAATKALKLCLQREKKRCQRELSDINLPVFSKRAEILEVLKNNDVVVIVAQTGSGKSTQIPQYLADDLHHVLSRSFLHNTFPKIVCTQPRRVACQSIAERVSQEYAGAIDIPTHSVSVKEQDKKDNLGVRRVSAYPLYSKLSQSDQNRALNIFDRVGFDQTYEQKKQVEQPAHLRIDLSGTPGELGEWVGFHIGSKDKSIEEQENSKKIGKETRIHFVTEGLLLQKLKGASNETDYHCIIIDEAHERGRDTDLLLAYLRELLLKTTKIPVYKGNNIKIVVMSASIDQKVFSDYFGGCPIIECKGRMFDVSDKYCPPLSAPHDSQTTTEDGSEFDNASLSDIDSSWDTDSSAGSLFSPINFTVQRDKNVKQEKANNMNIIIQHAVETIFIEVLPHEMAGDVLLFLPGQGEIDLCVSMINKRASEESQEQNENQKQCYRTRKVVCCTNIAETSLTIPGVTFVLDTGKARKIQYNNIFRVSSLIVTNISKASAKQRKGRAGRVEPGVCIKLYSQKYHEEMKEFDEPEIKQTSIDELYLYTLNVFGGLENIHLMEDASLEQESIYSSKKRLINLGYLQVNEDKVKISLEGAFALSLTKHVSLEGSKMILVSKKYEVVDDALALSVVLKDMKNIYIEQKNNNEERLKYFDELGDHLTVFNIYKHFVNKIENSYGSIDRRTETTKDWCEDLGLNFVTLQQISKSISMVYELIKKERRCDVANMFKKWKENIEPGKKKRREASVDVQSLLTNRETLMKLIVSGYFHNIGVLNDPEFIKSGYSLITPSDYGENILGSESKDLLKVMLSRNSSLMLFGDVTENTAVIFVNLFEHASGSVCMETTSRIKPEWIEECASKSWTDSIGLNVCNIDVIQSYVERKQHQFIGPLVLKKLAKLEDENKEIFLKVLEKKSNVKITLFFETSELRLYGSKKEIDMVQPLLLSKVNEIKLELFQEDSVEKYPKPDGDKQDICTIGSGLIVLKVLTWPRPEIVTAWNQLKDCTLILRKYIQSENHIRNVFTLLRSEISPELSISFEEPSVTMLGTESAKIRFRNYEIADEFKCLLKRTRADHFSLLTECFFSNRIRLQVIKTSLFPSVYLISKKYNNLIVKEIGERGKYFNIELVKKSPQNAYIEIDEFVGELIEHQVFSSELIEELYLLRPEVKEYIYWKTKNKIHRNNLEKEHNVIIKKRIHPEMLFEIFGECKNRKIVAKTLRTMIMKLKDEIENNANKYTYTFNRIIPMTSRCMISQLIFKIDGFRTKHQNIKMSILLNNASGNKSMPVVHILGDNSDDGIKALADMEKCSETDVKGKENPICIICKNEVWLRKTSRQKKKERQELKEARQDDISSTRKHVRLKEHKHFSLNGIQLGICGCTYCIECFKNIVARQLTEQRDAVEHKSILCVQCKETILMNDFRYSDIREYWINDFYDLALQNYLLLNMQGKDGERIDKCGRCKNLMVLCSTDSGVYRCHNDKCRFLFCCRCGKQCMGNQPDFDFHQQCKRQHDGDHN